MDIQPISRGELWRALVARSGAALACGALRGIGTRVERIEDGGMRFVVRVAENLKHKATERTRKGSGFNPFLPPEPELTVGALGPQHVAVLNKFNVVERHLLVVTRAFEAQEQLLTEGDLQALWWCLREYPGLGFYNGGTVAGASQGHKHLQLVPEALAPGAGTLPLEPLLAGLEPGHGSVRLASLPFAHRVMALPAGLEADPAGAATLTGRAYREMLDALAIGVVPGPQGARQGAPYNLLLTRRWLMVVPRRREHFESISVNAMGFAGSLFVRDEAELARVREVGPMRVLEAVAGKWVG